jgi:hypothetical protein
MEIRKALKVKCPYCQFENELGVGWQVVLHLEDGKPVVMTCDIESGGCDRPFVLQVDYMPVIAVSRIEPQPTIVVRPVPLKPGVEAA